MRNSNLLKSTVIVTIAMLLTRILGLIRESVLAGVYGAGSITDAFITAFTLPNTILACIGSSIATVYVPLYHENKEDANGFTSNIINTTSLLGLCLTIVFFLFPSILVSLFASGFDNETYKLATQFTRIMMLATIPILLFNVLKAYLQIFRAFFLATAIDGVINVLVIIGIVYSRISENLYIMIYGAVLGNVICLVCLFFSCRKHGFKYTLYINMNETRIKKMFFLILPIFIGIAVSELNTIIDRNFASSLASGTVSAMNYANKVNGILYSFLSTSVATVLYPELVKLAVEKKDGEIKRYINKCILILTYIILPLSALIFILANPIIDFLFQRGSFSSEDTVITAECVQMYAIGYLTVNVNPVLNRVFYAYNDTKTPTINSIIAVTLNIILNMLMIEKYKHMGLALSTSIASILTTILLLFQLTKKMNGIELKRVLKEILKIVFSCMMMSMLVYASQKYIFQFVTNTLTKFFALAVLTIMGLLIYIACSGLMGIKEVVEIRVIFIDRIQRWFRK